MPPMSVDDYRQRAEECDRLAASSTSPHVREIMLFVASRWRALADDEAAKISQPKLAAKPRPQLRSE